MTYTATGPCHACGHDTAHDVEIRDDTVGLSICNSGLWPCQCSIDAREIAYLRAELERATRCKFVRNDDVLGERTVTVAEDDPAMDATDGAHPAWWRGNDDGVRATVRAVNAILDGETWGVFGYAPLNDLAERLDALTRCDCGKPRTLGECSGNCDNDE